MDPVGHAPSDAGAASQPSSSMSRFRPYASSKHRVTRGRYITSNDRRGYIPVYEYPLNGQWIMMDSDDGFVLWTGIWKALGNAKADIVKMLESQPELASQLRRVRGGYLKIQGTWMPYEVALRLARRVAWTIREDLIPLFGPTFPSTCLAPDQPGYGQILGNQQGKRRGRRAAVPLPLPVSLPPPQPTEVEPHAGSPSQQRQISIAGPSSVGGVRPGERFEVLSPAPHSAGPSRTSHFDYAERDHLLGEYPRDTLPLPHGSETRMQHYKLSVMPPPPLPSHYDYPRSPRSPFHHTHSPSSAFRYENQLPLTQRQSGRFSPYRRTSSSRYRSSSITNSFSRPSPIDLPPLTIPSRPRAVSSIDRSSFSAHPVLGPSYSRSHQSPSAADPTTPPTHQRSPGDRIVLPPLQPPLTTTVSDASRQRSDSGHYSSGSGSGYSLPPISSLDDPPSSGHRGSSQLDSTAVLKRLALDDETYERTSSFGSVVHRHRLGAEGSYRDDDGNELQVDPPTEEQLWTRRRSLSEPPSQQFTFTRNQSPGNNDGSYEARMSPIGEVEYFRGRQEPRPDVRKVAGLINSSGGRMERGSSARSLSPPERPLSQGRVDDYDRTARGSASYISPLREGLGASTSSVRDLDQPGGKGDEYTPRQHVSSLSPELQTSWRPHSRESTPSGNQAQFIPTPLGQRQPQVSPVTSYQAQSSTSSPIERGRLIQSRTLLTGSPQPQDELPSIDNRNRVSDTQYSTRTRFHSPDAGIPPKRRRVEDAW